MINPSGRRIVCRTLYKYKNMTNKCRKGRWLDVGYSLMIRTIKFFSSMDDGFFCCTYLRIDSSGWLFALFFVCCAPGGTYLDPGDFCGVWKVRYLS